MVLCVADEVSAHGFSAWKIHAVGDWARGATSSVKKILYDQLIS
jgi:hypothetical protein